MGITTDNLRISVAAVAEAVASAYVAFAPPFDTDTVVDVFRSYDGVVPEVADRLAQAYRAAEDISGDGGKATVLIACRTVEAALGASVTEGRHNLPSAISLAAARASREIGTKGTRVRSLDQLARAATAAAGGDEQLGLAMVDALREAGRDGRITVTEGSPGHAERIQIALGEEDGFPVATLTVSAATEYETRDLYLRAWHTMYASIAAVAEGVLGGGGVGFVVAAEALGTEAEEDSVSGAASRAVIDGLHEPLRVRAAAAGVPLDTLLVSCQGTPGQAFDQIACRLISLIESGPLDPMRTVRELIRETGDAASDLLRLLG